MLHRPYQRLLHLIHILVRLLDNSQRHRPFPIRHRYAFFFYGHDSNFAEVLLGTYAAVQGGCRFTKDIPPYCVAAHEPTAFYSINTTVLQHEGFSETVIKHIAHAFRILYKVNTSTEDALRRIEEQVPSSPEIVHLIEFVRSSKLGIIK